MSDTPDPPDPPAPAPEPPPPEPPEPEPQPAAPEPSEAAAPDTPEPQPSAPEPPPPDPSTPDPSAPDPSAPDPSTPEQASWLQRTLGLDLAAFSATPGEGADGVDLGSRVWNFVAGPPMPRGAVPGFQEDRAAARLEEMDFLDRRKVRVMLDDASPEDRAYLEKALAGQHTPSELTEFAQQIAGKDAAWKQDNLHLVGESGGRGIKQQWSNTCGATTVEAIRGELDPVYALRMHQQNPNLEEADPHVPTSQNPELADAQKDFFDQYKDPAKMQYAAARDDPQPGIALEKALDDQAKATGLSFDGSLVSPSTIDADLSDMEAAARNGMPTPIRLAGDGADGHFALVSGVSDGPPRVFHIHDPWSGTLVDVPEADLKSGNFNIGGHSRLAGVFKPSAAKAL